MVRRWSNSGQAMVKQWSFGGQAVVEYGAMMVD
jgi:hypothetical protein